MNSIKEAQPLVVIAHPSGRLCNRLWLYANFIGNCCEYGYGLSNIAFYEYAEYFENLKDNLFCRYPAQHGRTYKSRFRQLLFKWASIPLRAVSAMNVRSTPISSHLDIRHYKGSERTFDLRGAEWESALGKRVVVVKGLEFRDWESLLKYRREILNFLAPRSRYIDAAMALAKSARMDSKCILCGIHIRQGDYLQYKSGSWYYSTEQYVAKMQEFSELFSNIRPVRFIVCSDECLPQGAFQGLSVTFGSGQFVEDMMTLSQCDYILGAPSTYSAWASFYGDVPLRFLFDQAPLTEESFIPVAERIRRHLDLKAKLGENLSHTGLLETCL